jgi:hypothetical protein
VSGDLVHMGTSDLLFWKKKIKNHISKFIFVGKKYLDVANYLSRYCTNNYVELILLRATQK